MLVLTTHLVVIAVKILYGQFIIICVKWKHYKHVKVFTGFVQSGLCWIIEHVHKRFICS